jgi:poly-gamma-glutamate capsule biosynthesis protein CapA/YwtB (metallophosphatase superfamily)
MFELPAQNTSASSPGAPALNLFLCGDVMTGRGIDQLLPQPSRPHLYEPYVTDARDYVRLAERASGPIARPVGFDYVWGEARAEIDRRAPQLRIVNLETAITTSEDAWPGKGIHYRMHPANVGVLTAARIDACALANSHFEENAWLDLDADGNLCAMTVEDASRRTGIPQFSHEQVAA